MDRSVYSMIDRILYAIIDGDGKRESREEAENRIIHYSLCFEGKNFLISKVIDNYEFQA